MDHTKALHHRGYALSLRPLEGGWDVHIGDPAGHVADVDLHCQLSQGPGPAPSRPWRRPAAASMRCWARKAPTER